MFNYPFYIEVDRDQGDFLMVELIPLLVKKEERYSPSGNFRLFSGRVPDAGTGDIINIYLNKYFDDIEFTCDNEDPSFLGELHFDGFAYFEWRYLGEKLSEKEIWQIVDLLQDALPSRIASL